MTLSTIIKQQRKELNLTLSQIADHVGVSKATVQRWESGAISNIRSDKISLLAEILQISPLALTNDTPTQAPPPDLSLLLDDFSYSMYNYSQALSEGDKKMLLDMAEYLKSKK